MPDNERPEQQSDEQDKQVPRKEDNPFSEQEKHGDEAMRRAPGTEREYQGGQPDERRAPGVEEDTEEERREPS